MPFEVGKIWAAYDETICRLVCDLTHCRREGITAPALMRASHINPWADGTTAEERRDPMNSLLLSALWEAASDRGLVSFSDAGEVLHAPTLSPEARLLLTTSERLPIAPERAAYLTWRRKPHGFP